MLSGRLAATRPPRVLAAGAGPDHLPRMTQIAHLPARTVLSVTGGDRVSFLNGLVSNDVAEAGPGRATWAALLTAQGKWLADFFILADGDRLLLDCEAAQSAMLVQRLSRYRLRAEVTIGPAELAVFAAWDGAPDQSAGVCAPDPRVEQAGWRVLARADLPVNASVEAWDAHRLSLGLPDGSRDLEAEKTVLLEAGFDELHGISWTKGCYMGQELTARTRYRGLVKRRLLPVRGAAPLPPSGAPIFAGDREIGQMRSSLDGDGLALLRLDALDGSELRAGETPIVVHPPDWARLPEPA
jgi:folate-binding protein YgfZ